MDIEFGDASTLDTAGTGWFLGFSEWTRAGSGLRHMPRDLRSHSLCMKWMDHPRGDPRGGAKPPSEGRTLSILVSDSGRFLLEFSDRDDFAEGHVLAHALEGRGRFAAWGEGIYHRWTVEAACTVLTLRWVPDAPSGVPSMPL